MKQSLDVSFSGIMGFLFMIAVSCGPESGKSLPDALDSDDHRPDLDGAGIVDSPCSIPDCPAASEDAAELIGDGARPDDSKGSDSSAACPSPSVDLVTSHKTLIPPPLAVTMDALVAGESVAGDCLWQAGPPSVCTLAAFGTVWKAGDGVCTVTCLLPDGTCGLRTLIAKTQTIIYVVGGVTPQGGLHSARISRLRVADGEWDLEVGVVPEKRRMLSVGEHGHRLFLVGGLVHGSQFDYESDPEYFPECPEAVESLGGVDGGCRSVRVFDLMTGTWTAPLKLPKARWGMGTAQIGQALYMAGGGQSSDSPPDTTHLYRLDMSKLVLHASPGLPPETAPKIAPRLVRFGSDLLLFKGHTTWVLSGDESWKELDLGFPCKNDTPPSALFSLPIAEPNLFVKTFDWSGAGPSGACPSSVDGPGAVVVTFKRFFNSIWSDSKPLEQWGNFVVATGGDGAYLMQDGYFPDYVPNPPPPPPVYRISSIDGAWETLPPMPYWRSDFAAVAVEQ